MSNYGFHVMHIALYYLQLGPRLYHRLVSYILLFSVNWDKILDLFDLKPFILLTVRSSPMMSKKLDQVRANFFFWLWKKLKLCNLNMESIMQIKIIRFWYLNFFIENTKIVEEHYMYFFLKFQTNYFAFMNKSFYFCNFFLKLNLENTRTQC